MTRGKLIVLEGADGAGTSTMSRELSRLIRATDPTVCVRETHEPSTGDIGTLIRKLLEAHKEPLDWRMMSYLFMADRMQHVKKTIKPALEEGKHVVCDRYYPSTLVYQSASAPDDLRPMGYLYNEMRGFNVSTFRPYNDPLWLEPDLCIYLQASSVEILKKRRAARGKQEMYEDDRTQKKVLDWYDYWYDHLSTLTVRIDADGNIETVRRECWEHVCRLLGIDNEQRDATLRNIPLP